MRFALLGDDPDVLPLVRAVAAADGHSLTHAALLGNLAGDVLTAAPQVRVNDDWSELLTAKLDAVIVGGTGERIEEAARRIAAEGTPLIVFPRIEHGDSLVYELALTRDETGIHIQAQYHLAPFSGVYVVLAGGPSVLDIRQSIVTDVNFTEEFPFDTATYVGVDSQRVTGTKTGFNVGADVRWMFARHVGVGGLVRYSHATVDLTSSGRTISVDAGGMQVGGGIRLAF